MATITGTEGDDYIVGTAEADTISGGLGQDTILGDAGGDLVEGGAGNDYLQVWAFTGNDTVMGDEGNDLFIAHVGDEVEQAVELHGGDGDDEFRVGVLADSSGSILATGGAGQDVYRFESADNTRGLTVADFQAGAGGDRIDIVVTMMHSATLPGGSYGGGNPFAADLGYFRLVQDGADTLLQYDQDGAAAGARSWRTAAILRDVDASTLTADNFLGVPLDGSPIAGENVAGTEFADELEGWMGDDTLLGGEGDDSLYGAAGDDLIHGGQGSDDVSGSIGNDTLIGGAGDDLLDGGAGSDSVIGGAGDDLLWSLGHGNDTLVGGLGHDRFVVTLDGTPSSVRVKGGEGDDVFRVGIEAGATVMAAGGPGRDTYILHQGPLSGTIPGGLTIVDFEAGASGDLLDVSRLMELSATHGGFTGGNPLSGFYGYVRFVQSGAHTLLQHDLDGAAGSGFGWQTVVRFKNVSPSEITADNFVAFTRTGTASSEYLLGGFGRDALSGLEGNDTLDGGWGSDTMAGGGGHDQYLVHDADDVVLELADGGMDIVSADVDWTLGDNVEHLLLWGGGARATGNALDNMIGGNSYSNVLTGGLGRDTLVGGSGRDRFDYVTVGDSTVALSGRDTIADFNPRAGCDWIKLSDIDANGQTAADDAFTFIGSSAFSSTDASGQLRFEYDALTGAGILYGSTDADAEAEFAIELTGVREMRDANLIL